MSKSSLYVVATHIGNWDDITLRALKVLKEVDFVICEERKSGSRLLRHYEIKKEIMLLNEHSDREDENEIFNEIFLNGKSAALISDAGTPLFADPGNRIVHRCNDNGIPVHPVPGPSSLMAMLMISGLKLNSFQYCGFLPANREERGNALRRYQKLTNLDLVFLEAPYRLKQILRDMEIVLGGQRKVMLGYKLTQPEEKFIEGTIKEMRFMTSELPKGEFVLVLPSEKETYYHKSSKRNSDSDDEI